jgi:hypothetical protein
MGISGGDGQPAASCACTSFTSPAGTRRWTANRRRWYATGELGLATVDVPAGTHRGVPSAFGATPARTAGLLLTLAAAAVWIALAFWAHAQPLFCGRPG